MRYRCTNCESCGAPLEIASRAKRASCDYCQSLSDATDLETLRWRLRNVSFQLELDLLDRNWLVERERLMVRNSAGQLTIPSRFRVLLAGGSVLLMCLGWVVGLSLLRTSAAVIGVFIGTPVAVWMTVACQRANEFLDARRRYSKERASLCTRFIRTSVNDDTECVNSIANPQTPRHTELSQTDGQLPNQGDASPLELSNLDGTLKLMILEGELQRLDADHRRHSERIKLEVVNETTDLTTRTSSIALLIAPLSVITFTATMGPVGLPIAVALTITGFLIEAKVKQLLLKRDFERREAYYNSERRRLQAQLEVTKNAA
ncbi:MAG: hypothetical protein HQ518_30690 [Rhodopirellula sp.]|nr:hypothetical protein [Rhodopirellula sp.]